MTAGKGKKTFYMLEEIPLCGRGNKKSVRCCGEGRGKKHHPSPITRGSNRFYKTFVPKGRRDLCQKVRDGARTVSR